MKCNRCQNEDPKLFAYDHGVAIRSDDVASKFEL